MNQPKPTFVAFDLEIVKPIPDGAADWKAHRPLGVSCAAVHTSDEINGPEPEIWYPGMFDTDPVPGAGGAMSREELVHLVEYLQEHVDAGYTILTWNGLSFDFDILAEESGLVEQCQDLALHHVDLMFLFLCHKGFPLSLEAAALGQGLDGITGDQAPLLWAQGPDERLKVLEYVAQDVRTLLGIAAVVGAKGHLSWKSRRGRWNTCDFFEGFLTVAQALHLPEPDTSWMTDPITRRDAYDWINPGRVASALAGVQPIPDPFPPIAKIRLEGAPEEVNFLADWIAKRMDVSEISDAFANRDNDWVRRYITLSGLPEHCRVCGCTNDDPCEFGCYWVEPGLCSQCVDQVAVPVAGVVS